MSLSTTVVACSVSVVFPCLLVVSVVVAIVVSVLIGVHTLVLVFSVVCILASVWNGVIWATGHHGFQCWALICYFYKPGIDLLVSLGYGVFSIAMVFPLPWPFWRLVTSVGVMKEFVFPSCPVLTMSRGFIAGPGWLSGVVFIINAGDVGLGCLP